MIDPVPPALIFIIGALIVPFFKGKLKSAYLLFLPVLGFVNLISIPEGNNWIVGFLDYNLVLGRVDRLSLIFGYIFHLISFIAILYSLHVKDDLQHVAGLVYAGSALGVLFAGSLFASVFLRSSTFGFAASAVFLTALAVTFFLLNLA